MPGMAPCGHGPGLSLGETAGYGAPIASPGIDDPLARKEDLITDAELRAALQAGAVIRRVVVVEVAASSSYVAWLQLSERPGFLCLGMRRNEGPRAFLDFRTLRKKLVERGFTGCLRVCPEGSAFLERIGIQTRA